MISYFSNLFKPKQTNFDEIFCMGVNLENSTTHDINRLKDLGIKYILIRFPMWEMDKLDEYKRYIEEFSEFSIMINLMQSRKHIENKELLKKDIKKIFDTFTSITSYQVGTTINRKKWQFYSVDEYLKFFETIKSVRDKSYHDIKLIGSSVIDFEYHFSIRSLFNFYSIFYDRFSALLYVDRRGSPFSTQAGFDLYKKIKLLFDIVNLSPKTNKTIYITETNWPISGTAPYAPTSEKECVSLEEYAEFMVSYYLIAIASRRVTRVYWHQLNAKGYGLIDNTTNTFYPAFEAYKYMVQTLKNKKLLDFDIKDRIKYFRFDKVEIFYHDRGFSKEFIKENDKDIYGNSYKKGRLIYRERWFVRKGLF